MSNFRLPLRVFISPARTPPSPPPQNPKTPNKTPLQVLPSPSTPPSEPRTQNPPLSHAKTCRPQSPRWRKSSCWRRSASCAPRCAPPAWSRPLRRLFRPRKPKGGGKVGFPADPRKPFHWKSRSCCSFLLLGMSQSPHFLGLAVSHVYCSCRNDCLFSSTILGKYSTMIVFDFYRFSGTHIDGIELPKAAAIHSGLVLGVCKAYMARETTMKASNKNRLNPHTQMSQSQSSARRLRGEAQRGTGADMRLFDSLRGFGQIVTQLGLLDPVSDWD